MYLSPKIERQITKTKIHRMFSNNGKENIISE